MKCPACKETDLAMSSRHNIEIDYCPQCRGVWLDRGELDKLIERSVQEISQLSTPTQAPQHYTSHPQRDSHSQYGYKKPYKKKSFWQEIFD
ncbi:hypothetical protein PAEH1_01020 [Paenalcaligenes hominis]|uniref:Transcription factor zinc-finger domain-containing protein n=1 Tax=Paenalcaligenes hominis TaxID=643674 RepID=A0A1U9JXE4_9BURK|nr:zf-TFIIB domain-containing protein [Paenalcaligenes hominis]AQS50473.1 hypothetical protein PAEH1_01020 [Paenalcaligenes hominis]